MLSDVLCVGSVRCEDFRNCAGRSGMRTPDVLQGVRGNVFRRSALCRSGSILVIVCLFLLLLLLLLYIVIDVVVKE